MVYDLPTERLNPSGMPEAQAPVAKNFAAEQAMQQGAAVTKAGMAAAQLAAKYQDDIDEGAVREADNALAEFKRQAVQQYLSTEQRDALDQHGAVTKGFQEKIKEIEGTLKNDTQRAMFKQVSMARYQSAMEQVDGHAINQAKAFNLNEAEKGVTSSVKDAVAGAAAWKDPASSYHKSSMAAFKRAEDYLALHGIRPGDSQYDEYMQKVSTGLHTEAIDQFLAGDKAKEADEYFKQYKDEIDPALRDDLSAKIGGAVAEVRGMEYGDQIFNLTAKALTVNDVMPMSDMISAVEKDTDMDSKTKKATIARLRELDQRRNEEKTANAREASNEMFAMANRPGAQYQPVANWVMRQKGRIDDTSINSLLSALDTKFHISEDRSLAKQEAAMDRRIKCQNEASKFMAGYMKGDFSKMSGEEVRNRYAHTMGSEVFGAAQFVDQVNSKLVNPQVSMAEFEQTIKTIAATTGGKEALGFDPYSTAPVDVKKKYLLFNTALGYMSDAGKGGPAKAISLNSALDLAVRKKVTFTSDSLFRHNEDVYSAYELPGAPEDVQRAYAKMRLKNAGRPATEENIQSVIQALRATR